MHENLLSFGTHISMARMPEVKVELLMDIDMLLMAEKTPWVECVILYISLQKEITNT